MEPTTAKDSQVKAEEKGNKKDLPLTCQTRKENKNSKQAVPTINTMD